MKNYIKVAPLVLTALVAGGINANAQEEIKTVDSVTRGTGIVCYAAESWGRERSLIKNPVAVEDPYFVIKRCEGQLEEGSSIIFNRLLNPGYADLVSIDSLTVVHQNGSVEAYVNESKNRKSIPDKFSVLTYEPTIFGIKSEENEGNTRDAERYSNLMNKINRAPTYMAKVRKEIQRKFVRKPTRK